MVAKQEGERTMDETPIQEMLWRSPGKRIRQENIASIAGASRSAMSQMLSGGPRMTEKIRRAIILSLHQQRAIDLMRCYEWARIDNHYQLANGIIHRYPYTDPQRDIFDLPDGLPEAKPLLPLNARQKRLARQMPGAEWTPEDIQPLREFYALKNCEIQSRLSKHISISTISRQLSPGNAEELSDDVRCAFERVVLDKRTSEFRRVHETMCDDGHHGLSRMLVRAYPEVDMKRMFGR
ncbi:MAG: hypothetical protein R6V19_06490 [Armatimonadota bacterium]